MIPDPGEGEQWPHPSAQHIHEVLDMFELLNSLHVYHEGALETDSRQREAIIGLEEELGRRMQLSQYVLPAEFNEAVAPTAYDEIKLVPRIPQAAPAAIRHAFLRYPRLVGEEFGLSYDDDLIYTNDVLIEIAYEGGDSYRYIMNSNGIKPYTDAEVLQYSDRELRSKHTRQQPNVFTVTEEYWHIPELTVGGLQGLLADTELQARPTPS